MARVKNLSVVFLVITLLAAFSLTMTNDAAAQGKGIKKYDYTTIDSNIVKAVKGENGNIEYSDELKKLLDQGWRIISILPGLIVLEKER